MPAQLEHVIRAAATIAGDERLARTPSAEGQRARILRQIEADFAA